MLGNDNRSILFKLLIVITLAVLHLKLCESARILAVFPIPAFSHQVVFRPITQELARRGHEVTVITTDPAFPKGEAPANFTEIDVHDISYTLWKEFYRTATGKASDVFRQREVGFSLNIKIFETQLKTPDVQKIIQNKEKKYDLLLVENMARAALIFSHLFKIPVIQISSLGAYNDNYKVVGGPTHPILYPSVWRQKLNNLTLWDKAQELYNHFKFVELFNKLDRSTNVMLKKVFGENTPEIKELLKNVDMLFLNTYPIWEGNFPVPPNVIYIGGLHQKPVQELPKDLKSFLDSARDGVIYMSFGTNMDPAMLPPEKIQIFFKVLSESPYEVLWKWNSDDVPGRAKNIRFSKWFPQPDLLRHPNVKLFITQGGLQSTDETITAGVPVIGVPMLADQFHNVEKYVQLGIGVKVDLETLTENNFKKAIEKVINDRRYREGIVRLRSIMQDQPMSPLDRAMFWAEHVIRHSGAVHLRSPAANLSWHEYLELDLLLLLLGIVLTGLSVCLWIGYHIIKFVLDISRQNKIKSD